MNTKTINCVPKVPNLSLIMKKMIEMHSFTTPWQILTFQEIKDVMVHTFMNFQMEQIFEDNPQCSQFMHSIEEEVCHLKAEEMKNMEPSHGLNVDREI